MLLSACPSPCTTFVPQTVKIVNAWQPEQLEQLQEIGRQLQQCRQQQSLTLEKLAVKTYIRHSILEAMEKADTKSLPEPVYIQGFLRRYGDALGLNGEALAQQLTVNRLHSASEISFQTVTETSHASSGLWTAVQHLPQQISSLMGFSGGSPPASEKTSPNVATAETSEENPSPEVENGGMTEKSSDRSAHTLAENSLSRGFRPKIAYWLFGLVAIAGLVVIYIWRPSLLAFQAETSSEQKTSSPAPETANSQQNQIAGNPTTVESQENSSETSKKPDTEAKTATTPPAKLPVIVEATERCWLQVEVNGQILFEGTLNPGDRKSWTTEQEITIVAGNAGGLLVYKGEAGSPKRLGASGEIQEITIDPTKPEIEAFE
jgi:cytoskeletal protein RodZ